MGQNVTHLMDEADIGSGEKSPSQLDDLKETSKLKEQQEQSQQQAHPQDGSQLHQVVEEQQFLSQHESHTPHGLKEDDEEHADPATQDEDQAVPNQQAARQPDGTASRQPPQHR